MRKRILCFLMLLSLLIGTALASNDIIYDGNNHVPVVTQSELDTVKITNEDYYITYYKNGVETSAFTNVGTYTVVVTITNSNFTVEDTLLKTFDIVSAAVSFTVSASTCTYDGQVHQAVIEVSSTGYLPAEGTDYKIYYEDSAGNKTYSVKDVGTYTIKVELLNSNLTISSEVLGEYTVNPRVAALSWSGMDARTYDGSASSVSATVSNLVSGDSCTVTVAGGTEKNAGTYTAEAVSLGNSNYSLSAEATAAYTINPRVAVLSWSGTDTRTYDGSVSSVSAAVSNLVSGDSCTVTVAEGTKHDAGTYVAEAVSLGNLNYSLPTEATATYTINPRVAVLSWAGTDARTYDGSPSSVTAAVSNLVSGDSCTVTVNGDTERNAGTYTAEAISLGNANYVLPAEATATYTINPRVAVLSWSGTTRTYDGNSSYVTAEVSNLVDGDSCTVIIANGAETEVGTYTAEAVYLSNANYVLPANATISYTIVPAAVSFELTAAIAYYDGQPHTAGVKQADTDSVRLSAGDYIITYRSAQGTTTDSVTEVGSYEVIVTVTNSNVTCEAGNIGTFTIDYLSAVSGMVALPENFAGDTWRNKLTLTAEEGYSISFMPDAGYGESITISQESDSAGTSVEYYVVAQEGGVVYKGTIVYLLDMTAPSITAVTGNPEEWQSTDVVLTVSASDTLSGIAVYSFDGGESWQAENTYTYDVNTTIPANTIQTKDAAGNVAVYAAEIAIEKIDKTAPVLSWDSDTAAAADGKWYAAVVINGTAADDQSGVESIALQVVTGEVSSMTEIGHELKGAAGTYEVTLMASDNVGNTGSSDTLTFSIDPIIADFQSYVSSLNGSTSTIEEVLAVLEWYESLTDDQKNHIHNSAEGTEAYNRLLEYWDAAQNRAVEEINSIIAAGGPTITDIAHAEDLYEKLDEEHKDLIDPDAWADLANKKDALEVEELIDLVPDHALSPDCTDLAYHRASIENAIIRFEALSSAARAYVDSDKVTFLRQQYALLLSMLGYSNKSGSVEIIGLVERVSAASDSTISVQVKQLTDTIIENQTLAYNISLIETLADGTSYEVQPIDGHTVTVKFLLDSGFIPESIEIYHVLDDGTQELIGDDNNLHFVTENGSIYAIFDVTHFSVYAVSAERIPVSSNGSSVALPQYTITGTAGTGGSITPGSVSVTRWGSTIFTIKADEGFYLSNVLLDGESVLEKGVVQQKDGSFLYTLEKVRADHTITAVFTPEGETPAEISFTDIQGHWAYDSIVTAYQTGLMNGVSEAEFNPEGAVTRAMVVTVLWRLAGEPAADSSSSFSDVAESAWYSEAVAWAEETGCVLGYGDGRFAPEAEISRQELASVLYRYLTIGEDEKGGTALNYSDTEAIASWALDAVEWCTANGILTGRNDGTFDPAATTTRAELAVILFRLLANN